LRRKKKRTEKEDQYEGLHQISDQSVHKQLRKVLSKQYEYQRTNRQTDQRTNEPTNKQTNGRSLLYYGVHKKCNALTKIVSAMLPVNEIFEKLVRSGKSSIRQRECDQPGPFPIICLEVTAV
jgi:hypothetical protein